eukprot:799001-Prymnesium_polylepis.1
MLTARRQFGDASMGSPAGQRARPRGARGRKADAAPWWLAAFLLVKVADMFGEALFETRTAERALHLPTMDVLSTRQEAMRLESDALFRRVNDLAPGQFDPSTATRSVDAPSMTGPPAGSP